jgi:tRNA pseudouridine55 synthase
MAEGEMLFLIGEETKRRDEFLGMDKEYETEIVLGIETDTFDVMGLIKRVDDRAGENISGGKDAGTREGVNDTIKKIVAQKVGKQMQKFPPFSKRHVQGRALFVWASEGRLDEIEIPEHEVEIYSIEVTGFAEKSFGAIRDDAIARIQDVVGDFRQEKIIVGWQSNPTPEDVLFTTLTLKVFCGTGTYIRQLAQDVGHELGCGATVLSIKRTKIVQKHV